MESDTDLGAVCLSKSEVSSFSGIISVRSSVNVKGGAEECETGQNDHGNPFPLPKPATADITTTSEEEMTGDDQAIASKRVGTSTPALVRVNTPPSKSTQAFKAEAEARDEALEETEPVPVYRRSSSCPYPTRSDATDTALVTASVQRSQSCPGSLSAAESTVGIQAGSWYWSGSQVSGLGRTSDEIITVLRGVRFKQINSEINASLSKLYNARLHHYNIIVCIGQEKELLYPFSKVPPPGKCLLSSAEV
jgi:hypothetical protein